MLIVKKTLFREFSCETEVTATGAPFPPFQVISLG
jgi:hypothetical protein